MTNPEIQNPLLEVRREPHGKRMFIVCKGESDIFTVPALQKAIECSLSDGFSHLTVDLSAVDYLDANTLSVLAGGYVKCQELNGTLDVILTGNRVRKIFEIVGFDKLFDIHSSREIALLSTAILNPA